MVNRQSFGGLHDAEHHLARDIAFLGEPILTQLAGAAGRASGTIQSGLERSMLRTADPKIPM